MTPLAMPLKGTLEQGTNDTVGRYGPVLSDTGCVPWVPDQRVEQGAGNGPGDMPEKSGHWCSQE